MSCPVWNECNRKACTENERCCDPEYWHSLSSHVTKVQNKISKRRFHYLERNNCSTEEGTCDKDSACKLLGQCIFTISSVKNNAPLKKALSYGWTMKEIIKILEQHDPQPMKSYYPNKKVK